MTFRDEESKGRDEMTVQEREQRAKRLKKAAEYLEMKAEDEAKYRKAIEMHDAPTNEARSRENQAACEEGARALRGLIHTILFAESND